MKWLVGEGILLFFGAIISPSIWGSHPSIQLNYFNLTFINRFLK